MEENVKGTIILQCTVGSTIHGLAIEGTDDRDEMAIMIEPREAVTGLSYRDETIVRRTKPEGVRSGPGDLDLVIHGLRKFMRLACGGNPTVLLPLFAPPPYCQVLTPRGNALRSIRKAIVSKKAGAAFLGYMQAQKLRLLGLRGQKRVKRPELIEAYGFDTKYSACVIRLGYQGIELIGEGKLTLPMREQERELILAVRRGEHKLEAVKEMATALEEELKRTIEKSSLRDEPDYAVVNAFLHETYLMDWKEQVTS